MKLKMSDGGFTLTEVLIAAALLGVLGLALASVFSLTTQIRQNAQAISDAQELSSLVSMQVANKKTCIEVMGALNSASVPTGTAIPAAAISGLTSIPYTLYLTPATTPTLFLSATPSPATNNNIYGQIQVNSVSLRIISVSPGTPTSQIMSALHFTLTKIAPSGVLGRQVYDIDIPVGLLVDTSASPPILLSCSSVAVDLGVPQCGAGQHLVLKIQSGSPNPAQWTCQ